MMVRSRAEARNRELKLFQVPLTVPTTPYSGPAGGSLAQRGRCGRSTTGTGQQQRGIAWRMPACAGSALAASVHAAPSFRWHMRQRVAPGRLAGDLPSRHVLSAEQVEVLRYRAR